MKPNITNQYLQIPVEYPGYGYTHSRFDWTGRVPYVVFDNKYTFGTVERKDETDINILGRGFYNEFGISRPIGYHDCPVGGQFPKIGVGLLTKDADEPYDFLKKYQIEPFESDVETKDDRIVFISYPKNCREYSVKYKKEIILAENTMIMKYELENTGEKKIDTNEYCHNFIGINNADINPGYYLRTPCDTENPTQMVEAVNPENVVILDSDTVKFDNTPQSPFFFSPLVRNIQACYNWSITHKKIGVGVSETVDFKPENVNLWGWKHVISPELFFSVKLETGEKTSWQRKFKFFYI